MESTYVATLPARARRLGGRIEGFGDIVFGFAVSQCALELPTSHGHVDLTRGASLFAYFGTFAVLTALWLTFHRVMSENFRPQGVDLVLAFAYLAFVSLMPFAMYSVTHVAETLAAARAAIAEYTILFCTLMILGATLTLRNLRRGWYYIDAGERDFTWTGFVRRVAIAGVMALGCGIDLMLGPIQSSFVLILIPIVLQLVRLIVRHAPSAARLHITSQTLEGSPAS